MNLQLHQADLVKVQSISGQNTLQLFPISKQKKKQKFVVGDDSGVLRCYQIKKGEPEAVFETPAMGQPILSVRIMGMNENSEKVFAASGPVVTGFTKKGKEFFKFESNLTEDIKSVYVDDVKLWTTTEYSYNHFDNGREKYSYMCQDRINATTLQKMSQDTHFEVVLGCQDKQVRLIKDSELLFRKTVAGPVTALTRPMVSGDIFGPREVVYGTVNGALGQLVSHPKKLKSGWKVPAAENAATVNCLSMHDIARDGTQQLLVGRDDGKFEVYAKNEEGSMQWVYDNTGPDSIRGVCGGEVTTSGFSEALACTYTGRVVSYTTEPLHEADESDNYGRSRGSVQRETRIIKLRKELTQLKDKIVKEKEKATKQPGFQTTISDAFAVNHSFKLLSEEAAYHLSVEIPGPIDTVIIQSLVPLDLLDTETNQAIVNVTTDPTGTAHTVATYRCQEPTNRFDLKLRTMEGPHGDINVIIISNMKPKNAQLVKFSVKPLSLHRRMHTLKDNMIPAQTNELTFTGNFSITQAHEWISHCLAEVPLRIQEDEVTLNFISTYLGSILICKFRKGEVSFMSDSLMTVAILKEVISKEATARKITVNMNFNISDETILSTLHMIRPKLDEQHAIACQVNLIEAIKEIEMQEEESDTWLSDQYKAILKNADKIQADFRARPRALQYLGGVLTDFFMDIHKFRGHNAKNQIPKLHQLLENYNFEDLCAFFTTK